MPRKGGLGGERTRYEFRRWILPDLDKEAAALLAEEAGLDPFLTLMLSLRGITDVEEALEFLTGWDLTADPLDFADIDKAAARIRLAIDSGERILVYGDYDADGVTSTVLLYSYLKEKGADVLYMLPEREGEGYGLHKSSVDSIAEAGVRLIVTVDNGISAMEEIAYAREKGMDVVVTDHHQPPGHPARCGGGCQSPPGRLPRANSRTMRAWALPSSSYAHWKGISKAFSTGMPTWWRSVPWRM